MIIFCVISLFFFFFLRLSCETKFVIVNKNNNSNTRLGRQNLFPWITRRFAVDELFSHTMHKLCGVLATCDAYYVVLALLCHKHTLRVVNIQTKFMNKSIKYKFLAKYLLRKTKHLFRVRTGISNCNSNTLNN